ncbi:MAG TPA: hypothetical protein VG267_22520 [Terracidiphilus sp.]|jgi:hypothetical protein|nr:hypothetical protein [Terracidiphilus sp.]
MGSSTEQRRAGFRAIPAWLRVALVCAAVAVLAAGYRLAVRPSQLHWGAATDELRMALPEDGIVAHPAFDATRAITIQARPEQIWPWLVQMGYGRAGFYGYDLIESPGGGRGLSSATAILPELQHPRAGDALPLSVAASLQFGTIDPNRALVWRSHDTPHSGVFIWALVPVDGSHTRLISRIRWRYLDDPWGHALGIFTEFADHVAVKAILRGVRDRAEGRRPGSLVLQGFEIGGWMLAMLEVLAAMAMVLRAERPVMWWCGAVGAGLMLMLVLYGGAPAWLNALIPWAWLGGMVWTMRGGRLFRGRQVRDPAHQETALGS